ncbi:MAG: ATP-binding cassette domain-containing protein, partial [Peptococcia bacterium]
VQVTETSEEELAEMMVGRRVIFDIDKKESQPKEAVLKIENLNVKSNRGFLGLKDFSLEVRAGEIVGVAGVDGNGQTELVEAITGLRKAESGTILLNNSDITNISIRERNGSGLGHIPEDRQKHGLILEYSLEDNLVLKKYYQEPFSRNGLLQREAISQYAMKLIEEFDVRAGQGGETSARSLSGGNQQKAIVAREIEQNPELLIAVQPTRGLDVGAIEYIHKRLIEQRDNGKAVLLISLELDEILRLSDRIAVLNNGEIVGLVQGADTNENEIGLMMAGVKRGNTA